MSKIINFPLERTKQQNHIGQTSDAELIIFPGVRIERVEQTKTGQTTRANTLSALRKQAGKIKET